MPAIEIVSHRRISRVYSTAVSRSVRGPLWGVAALVFGELLSSCAASAVSKRDALRARCEADLAYDPSCIEVLTSAEGYETREHVLKADEDREAEAFRARLARMRNAEEERQGARAPKISTAKTSTAGAAAPTDADGSALKDLLRADWDAGGPEEETGSSVRALRAAPAETADVGAEAWRPEPPGELRPPALEDGPTPESYLRGARCLLAGEGARLRVALEREKSARSRGSKERLGALALAIVETDTLLSSIDAEITHRGLPRGESVENCGATTLEAVGHFLRRVAGLEVEAGVADAERYGAGLVQLRQALERRAGLPRRP